MRRAARIARDPLAQFALVTLIAFGVHLARGRRADVTAAAAPGSRAPVSREIAITSDFVASLRADLAAREGRPPDDAELRAALERHLDEEVLFREALALGLDRGDVIVRRRLVQKMEFAVTDTARLAPADDATLQAWVSAHPERYREPATVSFVHVFFGRDRRGGDAGARRDAEQALATLQRPGSSVDPATLGDPFPLGQQFAARPADELDARFGDGFFHSLEALPENRWAGPVTSRYGLHLVRVSARASARVAPLASVRARAEADRADALREQANRDAIARLRARYHITVSGLRLDGVGARDGGAPR